LHTTSRGVDRKRCKHDDSGTASELDAYCCRKRQLQMSARFQNVQTYQTAGKDVETTKNSG